MAAREASHVPVKDCRAHDIAIDMGMDMGMDMAIEIVHTHGHRAVRTS